MTFEEYCEIIEDYVSRRNARFTAFVRALVEEGDAVSEIGWDIRERIKEDDAALGKFEEELGPIEESEPNRTRRVLQI